MKTTTISKGSGTARVRNQSEGTGQVEDGMNNMSHAQFFAVNALATHMDFGGLTGRGKPQESKRDQVEYERAMLGA